MSKMAEFAIVGYGKMGKLYDKLLKARYVVDLFPVPEKVYFKSVDEFISYGPRVDLVIVATGTPQHYEIARKLLNAGYHILVEKPLTLSYRHARELERLARKRGLTLYQSTLERYNPLIKFARKNIPEKDVESIESYRYNVRSQRACLEAVQFDLGIHDVDLWFHLYPKKRWTFNTGIGSPRREIVVNMKGGEKITMDLFAKVIFYPSGTLDFSVSSVNNPILEMVNDILFAKNCMNERWSEEIRFIEENLL